MSEPFEDQMASAARDVAAGVSLTAEVLGVPLRDYDPSPYVAEFLRWLDAPLSRRCEHLERTPAQAHYAMLAMPTVTMCADCAQRINEGLAGLGLAQFCDLCGAFADPANAGTVAIGPLVLGWVVCSCCLPLLLPPEAGAA